MLCIFIVLVHVRGLIMFPTTSFQPTHLLVTRTKQVPVELIGGTKGFQVLSEHEWLHNRSAAFVFHPKLGFSCHGVPVVGYSLQPITADFVTPISVLQHAVV